jgi:hypothetical protein
MNIFLLLLEACENRMEDKGGSRIAFPGTGCHAFVFDIELLAG